MDYLKITLDQARTAWNNGATIYLLPLREGLPVAGIKISMCTNKELHEDFDTFVSMYKSVSSKRMGYYFPY